MPEPHRPAEEICAAFGLGTPTGKMAPVAGGLTHRMYRLTTERGAFAIKDFALDPEGAWTVERVERSFAVEQAAFEAGVRMPRPVVNPATGGCLAEVATDDGAAATVRVHEWAEGEGLQRVVFGPAMSGRCGEIVARVHGMQMMADVTQAAALKTYGSEHWEQTAERVERSEVEWKWEFRAILHTIAEMEAYVDSGRADTTPLLMSHRDADQKNFMKTPSGELLLVDWDAAGPVHPRHEVASLALTWAGVHLGEPDWKSVRGWIEGYRRAGGELDAIQPTDLGEFAAVMLGWFEFNVRRALGAPAEGEADRKLAADIVRRQFRNLPRFARSLDRWTALLAAE
jgi:hypothetical protein